MARDWRSLVMAIMLAGCTQADTSVSHRDILDDYKALNIRLDQLSHPLLAGNQDICDQTSKDNGIRWHQLEHYPEELQPVAQSYWNVSNDRSVFYVLPGSIAAKAGVKSGDMPSEDALADLGAGVDVCQYPVLVSYIEEINAYATGNEIIVTSGMMRAIEDDQYLSLVLAHELSHNILDHIDNPTETDMESAADEAAVKLMARAGLDYEEAIKRREAFQVQAANGEGMSEFESARISKFKGYSRSTKLKQETGEALWP